MAYSIKTLQNVSGSSNCGEKPTIVIEKGSPQWEMAYENWKQGKFPTASPEWKKGVFAIFEEKINE